MIPQPRARRRHEKILDAALRVFARKGYRDAAVDDIAVESRTSKGGVYFHFPGKQAIFLELLNRTAKRLRQKIEEAIESESDPILRADAALLVVLRTFASHRALARLFMIEALGAGKEFHQRLSEIHDEFASIIKEQLDEAVAQGVIAPLDTQVAATAWFGALNEVVTRWLLAGTPARLQDAYDALRPLLIRSVGVADAPAVHSFEDELEEKLRAVLERGRSAAPTRERAFLACLAVQSPAFDAASIFDAAAGGPRVLLEQPSEGFSMAAAGEAACLGVGGHGRFRGAREDWHCLVREAVVDAGTAPLEAPVALARFAFSPLAAANRAAGAPDGVLIVPRLLWLRHGSNFWLIVSTQVAAGTDIEAELASLQADVARLTQARVVESGAASRACLAEAQDREAWEGAVRSVVDDIRAGAIEKVVLAREVTVTSEAPIDAGRALRRLRERFQTCTVFAFDQDGSCFFGATPERLLRIQDGVVSVDCLAGSISRGTDETEDRVLASRLLHDPKELHEHRVVGSAIEEALRPLCSTLDIAAAPQVKSFANVHHLYTPISGTAMPGQDVFEFVERLHPTPAVGGYPREPALELITKYETFERGWYAGPIGWVDAAGNGDFAVAIRSGVARGNEATLYAGSGIVDASDPACEYDETNVKLQALLWALGVE